MTNKMDEIHHIAIEVNDIQRSLDWYTENFLCEISYQDDTWALLRFENISLALVLPNEHPNHFAITRDEIAQFGKPTPHRDGTSSVYIPDPDGNVIEMLKLKSPKA